MYTTMGTITGYSRNPIQKKIKKKENKKKKLKNMTSKVNRMYI